MNPDSYRGLLGRIAFAADMIQAGHTQEEADAAWEARFAQPEPDNVIYVNFSRTEPDGA